MTRLLPLLAAALLTGVALADDAAPEDPVLRLTLSDAIERALRGNADLAVERLSPRIADEKIEGTKGAFDPVLSASWTDSDARTKTASTLSGARLLEERSKGYDAGIEKKLETGTTLDIDMAYDKERTNNSFSTLNPSHASSVTLTVRQSLLKGFGTTVNRADTEIARHDAAAARQSLAARIDQTIHDVETAYWDLAAGIENAAVQERALEAARSLESANKARLDAGTLPRTEFLAAASAVASREADLMDARRKVQDSQDRLRRLIALAPEGGAAAGRPPALVPVDPPAEREIAVDADAAIDRALAHRPEIHRARLAIEAERLRKIVAADALKPDLSVEGSWTNERLERSQGDALRGFEDDEARTWQAVFSLEYPIGNRKAESDVKQSEARIAQEAARIRSLRETIAVEVREAGRALDWGLRRLAAQRRAVDLSSENLRAEQVRYEQGLSVTQDVLKALADDTAERARLLAARVDYAKAISGWQKAQGILAESKGVKIE